jgi:Tripartite tricarboxylate transporter TctB family
MTRLGGTRLVTLGLLAVALIGLWQALRLESWGFDGPGPGFFPQLMAGICVALAIVVLVFPGRAGETEGGDTEDAPRSAETYRTFALYAATFGVLAVGAMYAGFAVTTIVVTVLIMRFAERRSWAASAGYGVACAAVGLVCFGWLLRVDLPEGPIERTFYTLVR